MGQAKQRGNFAERKQSAEQFLQEQDAKQSAFTERYNHAIEKVVIDTVNKWATMSHPLLYIDYSLIEDTSTPNNYDEEILLYTVLEIKE